MIVLSNCLSDTADEGGLKLATTVVKRIKKAHEETCVIAYNRNSSVGDFFFSVNKFMLNWKMISFIFKKNQPVLYIPFPSKSLSLTFRIWIVSLFSRKRLKVMLIRQYPMGIISRFLLRTCGADLFVFSYQAKRFYESIVDNKVTYIKTGVDTQKFVPVSDKRKCMLKTKYGLDADRPVVLHVGHMKEGRNIRQLMKVDKKYQVVLVISSLSKERQDYLLRTELDKFDNIFIFDDFIPNIEEIYQLSDVYFFPVEQIGHCIDVPLSCLEAAACNKPIISTDYGEMGQLIENCGFYKITDFSEKTINELIAQALQEGLNSTRSYVLDYDWNYAVDKLVE